MRVHLGGLSLASDITQTLYDLCVAGARPEEVHADWVQVALSSRLNRTTLLLRSKLRPGPWDDALREPVERASKKLALVGAGIPLVTELCDSGKWDWLVFKTDWHFPKEMSDIDVLLGHGTDLDAVGRAVVAREGTIVEREAHKLKAYLPVDGAQTTLDFHTKITQDDLDFFDELRLMRERRTSTIGGHRAVVPSSEDEVLALCLEAYFGDSILNLAVLIEIGLRFAEPGFDPARLRALAWDRNWGTEVESVLYAIDQVHKSCAPQSARPALSHGVSGARGRALERRFGSVNAKLPAFFPFSWVSRDLLAKGRTERANGDKLALGRARHAIRRQAGARLYGIPFKVDGRVEKVP